MTFSTVRIIYNILFGWFTASLIVFFLLEPAGFFHVNKSNHTTYGTDYRTEYYTNSAGQEINLIITENPQTPTTDHIILYMHGTTERLPYFMTDGSLYMPVASATAPGYHGSEGYPTISNTKESLNLALKKLNELGYENDKIIVMGHSLGSMSAINVARKHPDVDRTIIINGFNSTIGMCWNQAYILCGLTSFKQNNFIEAWLTQAGTVHIFTNPDDAFISADKGILMYEALNTDDKRFFTTFGDHGGPTVKQILTDSLDEKPIEICDGCDDINAIRFEDERVQPTATIDRGPARIEQIGRITSLWIVGFGMLITLVTFVAYYYLKRYSHDYLDQRSPKAAPKIWHDLFFWVFLNIGIILIGLQIPWWYWRVTDMDYFINFVIVFLPVVIGFPVLAWLFRNKKAIAHVVESEKPPKK